MVTGMIVWQQHQRERIVDILDRHPPESNACVDAARQVLPIAREIDEEALTLVIKARGGRSGLFICPVHPAGRRWRYHVTVHASMHRVDALTGADGHPAASYLDTYFQFPDELQVLPIEEHEWRSL